MGGFIKGGVNDWAFFLHFSGRGRGEGVGLRDEMVFDMVAGSFGRRFECR